MTTLFRLFTAAISVFVAVPAAGQTLLLDASQKLPMAAILDNPCTPGAESILFQGATELVQRVWLTPTGNLRLQLAEETAMEGSNPSPLGPGLKYVFGGNSESDVEFEPVALSLLKYKKVVRDGIDDDFHAILVFDFDPQSLQLSVKYEAACTSGAL